jgi:hypothetical protein
LQKFNLLLYYYREKSEIKIKDRVKKGKNVETNRRDREKVKEVS